MKKSKVIIPAMAMILFSTAASISGTVAWFTASRVFDTEVGEFKIAQLEGNLDAVVAPGIGTMKGAGNSIVVGENATANATAADTAKPHYLVDASFNHTTGVVYKQDRDVEGSYNHYEAYGTATDAVYSSDSKGWIYKQITASGTTTSYYLAVTWNITFSYTFNTETADVGVYLDFSNNADTTPVSKSRFVPSKQNQSATGTRDSKKGFRIAFLGGIVGRNVVWGDLASTTSGDTEVSSQITVGEGGAAETGYAYVKDDDETNFYTLAAADHTSATATGDFIDASYKRGTYYAQATNATGQTSRLDRVATIAFADRDNSTGKASKTVTCVAWYEGSDPNIKNGTIMESMRAYMSFYSRLDAAA